MESRVSRGWKRRALLALSLIVPSLGTVALTAKPAAAANVTRGEFYIEGRGHFSTDEAAPFSLELPTAAVDAYNITPTPASNDIHWALIGYKINGADNNVVISAPQGTALVEGGVYTGAVGSKTNVPGIRFEGCETESGQFIVDYLRRNPADNKLTALAFRFEHHCGVTTIGSIAWNAPENLYAAHRASADRLDFGSVSADGGSASQIVTVQNTSGTGRSITVKAGITGFGVGDFSVSPSQCTLAAPGNTCNFTVTATPGVAAQSLGNLVLKSGFTGDDVGGLAPTQTGQVIPLIVTGTGIGKARIELDYESGHPISDGGRQQFTQTLSQSATGFSTSGGVSLSVSGSAALVPGGVYAVTGSSDPAVGLTVGSTACSSLSGVLTIAEYSAPSLVARFKLSCGSDRFVIGQVIVAPQGAIASHTITPKVLSLPTTDVGSQSTAVSINYTNQGGADTVVNARLVGLQQLHFGLLANTCDGVTLPPGKSCAVAVVSAPQAAGAFTAAVAFRDTYSAGQDQRTFITTTGNPNGVTDYTWGIDGEFVPLSPARILDTRDGTGQPDVGVAPLGAGAPRVIQVLGQGGVPTSGVDAVVLNVTVTNATAPAYLTVYPYEDTDNTPPLASNLNFVRGQTVPNLVVARVGDAGSVSIYTNAGSADVIFDVTGWVTSAFSTSRGGRLVPVTPTRLLDTRDGTGGYGAPVGGGSAIRLQVADPNDGYTAAVLNVTGTDTFLPTFVTAYPSDLGGPPLASNLNLERNQTRPNLVMVKLGPDGAVNLYNHSGAVNLIADLVGLYKAGGLRGSNNGRIIPTNPTRIVYTPSSVGPLAGGNAHVWDAGTQGAAAGLANMGPGENLGFIANFTATAGTNSTFLTAYPANADRPNASNLNVLPREDIPNLAVVALSPDNKFAVYNHAGNQDYIFDVVARIGK